MREIDAILKKSLSIFREMESDREEIDIELIDNLHSYEAYSKNYLKQLPTPQQLEIARLLDEPPYKVLVPSANNVGKTWLMGSYARYKYQKHNPGEVLITATTAGQVRDGVFKEIRSSMPLLPGIFPRATRVESAPNHYIHGYTSANADAFQGRHSLFLTLLFDEGTGIHPLIWERAGTMFGGVQGHSWLVTYNPNDPSTPPYAEEESGGWHTVRLNALEHPNTLAELRGEAPPIPSAIRLTRILDRIATECEPTAKPSPGSPEELFTFEFPANTGFYWKPITGAFEAQVLGRWPLINTESIISPTLVDMAFRKGFQLNPEWPLVISCDVARFGSDSTVFVLRRGPCILAIEKVQKRNCKWIVERLAELLHQYALPEERSSVPIVIDETGGYGGGVIDFAVGMRIIPVNFSSASPQELVTVNMRSHLWFNMAEFLRIGGVDISRLDPAMVGVMRKELSAARYRFDERGRKRVEPKTQIKQRLGYSPDIADAIALSYYWIDG